MIGVSRPIGRVAGVGLIAPDSPTLALASGKQLQMGAGTTGGDERVLFVGFARVLPFARAHDVDLSAPGLQCSDVLAARPKKQDLGDIAKVKPDAPTVRTAIFANFLPYDV